ncbi:MAG: hypothetical protein Q9160_001027 [Pyrenula sp. 1 TL-2023]
MSSKRVAVVTGANKGIGLAIVRNLALQYPQSPLKNGTLLVYLTARNTQRGEAAIQELLADQQLSKAKALTSQGGLTELKFHELDISATKSIQNFRDFLKDQHPDGIDIVINNAGIAMRGFDDNVVKKTLETNYYGTLEACQDLLPLLKPHGRLVNVSSIASMLNSYPPNLQESFRTAKGVPEITSLMESFKAAVAAKNENAEGWPSAAYSVSKAGLTGLTKVLAREEQEKNGSRLINACCPGYVVTDMTRGGGQKTPDQGAQTPVMLALADIKGQSGLFWESERPLKW